MPPPRLIFVLLDLCLRDWRSPERQKKIPNRFYRNPILFVAKILLFFRQQATGNRQHVRVSIFFIYFLICRNLFRIAIVIEVDSEVAIISRYY